MKYNLDEIRSIVEDVLSEASKKKDKSKKLKSKAGTAASAYGSYAEAFDFSAPLAGFNLYRNQGPVNWGPMTSGGTKIYDNITSGKKGMEEAALRSVIRGVIGERVSAWETLAPLAEDVKVPARSIWESISNEE
jgi:hypothetical protein